MTTQERINILLNLILIKPFPLTEIKKIFDEEPNDTSKEFPLAECFVVDEIKLKPKEADKQLIEYTDDPKDDSLYW